MTSIALVPDPEDETPADATVRRMTRIANLRRDSLERQFQASLEIPPKGDPPEVGVIQAGDVRFDLSYQKDARYELSRARKLATAWDWAKFRPIDINFRPGDKAKTAWCPDGRHRTEAAIMRFGPDIMLPCRITHVPYTDESLMFAYQDEGKKRVGDALKFNAEQQGEVPAALEAQALLDRLGLSLGIRTGRRQIATNTFLAMYRIQGEAATEAALRIILERWNGDAESLDSRIIKGFAAFMVRYADEPNFQRHHLADAIAEVSILELHRRASEFSFSGGEHKRIAAALVKLYNYRRRKSIPDWASRS